ncbi:MAG: alpha/beta hydrolase [Aggregatilineales bacterium]
MKRWGLIILAVLLLGIVPTFAQDDELPIFEEDDCIFPELDGVTCGYLIVPEDRADPDSPEIYLAVAIIGARNGTPLPDPVIYLEGGPGGAAIFAVEDFMTHPLAQNRDLILIDQRGTGFSEPSLNCYEMEEGESEDPTTDCYERLLEEGINLSAYTSADNAADIADLRVALGYDEVNLYGISYGTRLALSVMRDHPEGIRSVVIDSVYPPEVNSITTGPEDTVRAFTYLFDACAADADCNAAYPNLEADFYAMIEDFNLNPPTFVYDDGEGESDVELYGDDILEVMFQTLYVTDSIPMLPYGITLMLNAADDFDYSGAYEILSGFWTPVSWIAGESEGSESVFTDSDAVNQILDELGDITDNEGMYNSVTCAEETPFEDFDSAYASVENAPAAIQEYLYQSIDTAALDCDIWQVDPSAGIEAERVVSDIPTLVISGGFDPVTPPSYGDSAAQGLSNSLHLVFANGGHGISGSPGCAANIVHAFVDDPSAPIDDSCRGAEALVEWYIED